MKKFLIIALLSLASVASFAEATFDQIEGLIQQKNYAAAEAGLEVIIKNHPNSAKAFYAMAQAQAGLGNQEKALKALNIATGLNPTLDFAPEGSVQKLKQAITPQTAKIEAIEESHTARNVMIFLVILVSGFAIWFAIGQAKRKAEDDAEAEVARREALEEYNRKQRERDAERKREHMEMLAKQDAERKAELAAEAALKAHKNYGHERFDPSNPDKLKSVKQFKEEKLAEAMVAQARAEAAEAKARAERAEMDARLARSNASSGPATTVVNNSSNDMLTGIMIGNMMNGSHHHDTERTVIRETVREVPTPSYTPAPTQSVRDTSWDDTPSTPSRSSSWDDDSSSSSKSSSSWSSSSSSDSGSSWSSSSDSSSSSSSSWD
jgi:tetratricopeptide (TPR) repeat protein